MQKRDDGRLGAALLRGIAQLIQHRAANPLGVAALPALDRPLVVAERDPGFLLREPQRLANPAELRCADVLATLHGTDPSTTFRRESRNSVDTTVCRLLLSALVTRQTVVGWN